MKTIKVFTRTVYGNTLMYVFGTDAKYVSELTRKLTVNNSDLDALKALGLNVKLYFSETEASLDK